ncbi:Sua5/YciO/YrdC/YwlC family protein [Candidatus Saccharibacteria bacterium]|nr:Sua5/YciO/YrdC/YwlC family protein [Candidatus Saccharibacteria bacterium]
MKSQSSDLLAGKIVTLPTETVNGYAVSLNSKQAIIDLMQLKERDFDSDKIFTLVPESVSAISKYVITPPVAKSLIDRYIPGELTIILPKNPDFHHFYFDEIMRRGRFNGIGIRIPDYPLFAELLPETGPLLLTSANPRGGTPKSVTGHLPSTIIDFTGKHPRIIRQGNLHIDPTLYH